MARDRRLERVLQEFLDDLRALLPADVDHLWPGVERAFRRDTALPVIDQAAARVWLGKVLDSQSLAAAPAAEFARYEDRLDKALRDVLEARQQVQDAMAASTQVRLDARPYSPVMKRAWQMEADAARQTAELHRQTLITIARQLPAPEGVSLRRRYYAAVHHMDPRIGGAPPVETRHRALLAAAELSDAQGQRLQGLLDKHLVEDTDLTEAISGACMQDDSLSRYWFEDEPPDCEPLRKEYHVSMDRREELRRLWAAELDRAAQDLGLAVPER